jgi:hypothetical protein
VKKPPSLFVRDWNGPHKGLVTRDVNPECQWVVDGEGMATRKRDGTACAVIGGRLYKRHDCKAGSKWAKNPPADWIACQDPDPVTGHWPHWAPVGDGPGDKWHAAAWAVFTDGGLETIPGNVTLELCGPHFQTNAEGLDAETFYSHGSERLPDCPRDFDGLVAYLTEHVMEGIVWHHPDGRMAKIKAKDFGLQWPRTAPDAKAEAV